MGQLEKSDLREAGLEGPVKKVVMKSVPKDEISGTEITTWTFDRAGAQTGTTLRFVDRDGQLIAERSLTRVVVRSLGTTEERLIDEKGSLKERIVRRFDSKGRQIERTEYGNHGQLTQRLVIKYEGNTKHTTLYSSDGSIHDRQLLTLDEHGRTLKSISFESDGSKSTMEDAYDKAGRHSERIVFDENNTIRERLTYQYDGKGNQTSFVVSGPSGHVRYRLTSSYQYDNLGNWVSKDDEEWRPEDSENTSTLARVTTRLIEYWDK